MGRPRGPRYYNGVRLVDNLYADNKQREGKWRYRRPNGSAKIFDAETVHQANEIAEHFNAMLAEGVQLPEPEPEPGPTPGSWGWLIEHYIEWRELQNPSLLTKVSWRNMRYTLHQFGREFSDLAPHKTTRMKLVPWWDSLSHHQQNKRHTELRRLFNWAMGERFCSQLDYNPFTLSDDRPRLYLKEKGEKARKPLTRQQFWETYHRAGDEGLVGLQRAMAISLVTTMRQGDICKLRFSQVVDGQLRVVIGKSEAQRGAASATRLAWSLEDFPLLRDVITDAREGSLAARRCPFIIYHVPMRARDYRTKADKDHPFQMKADLLQKQFKRVRPQIENPPTFHEIRALSSVIYRRCGHKLELIKELMAHTDEATTRSYQDYGDLPYKEISLRLTAEDIGGTF
jgi:integrase